MKGQMLEDEYAVSPKNADRYVERKSIIVDLRSHEEYAKGHLQGAVNVEVDAPIEEEALEQLIRILYREMADKGRSRRILLYCHRGGTSMLVANELQQKGINVYTLVGGMDAYRGKYLVKSV